MKELRIEVRAKNNILYRAIKDRWPSIAAFSREAGIQPVRVSSLLNLHKSPLTKKLTWTTAAVDIAAALQYLPEDLFPLKLYDVERTSVSFEVGIPELAASPEEMLRIPDPFSAEDSVLATQVTGLVRQALDTLKPREAEVLRMCFGVGCDEHTLNEVSDVLGVQRERVRQILAGALKKLRHPTRSRPLRGVMHNTT